MSCRALALVAVAAFALAGCGEKDEPGAPSAAAAIPEGDEICREGQERIAGLRGGTPSTPDQAAELTRGVIAAYEEEIAALGALEVPAELKADLDRYLAAREEALDPLRDGLAAARKGDAEAYAEAQAAVAEGQLERTRLADAVGFSDCSSPTGSEAPG